MQTHMSFLDAFRHQRFDGGEILRQSDRCDDGLQFGCRTVAENFFRHFRGRVEVDGSAHSSDRQRQRQTSEQISVFRFFPGCQRTILSAARGIGMRSRRNGAPVVSGCQHDGVDAVHDAFVIGDGAIRIDVGKLIGFNQSVAHFITGKTSSAQET